jgi:hypothetical protein
MKIHSYKTYKRGGSQRTHSHQGNISSPFNDLSEKSESNNNLNQGGKE